MEPTDASPSARRPHSSTTITSSLRRFLTKPIFLAAVCAGSLLTPANARAAGPDDTAKTSAAALYNEGNAAQRLGRTGPAILNYERAQWLAPGDAAIAHNLKAAREKAGLSAPAVPFWKRPAHWLSMDGAATLGSLSLLLVCLLFFGVGLIPPTLRRLARGTSLVLLLTTLLSASAVAARWTELNHAIITAPEASARIAPAENAAHAFELKPGELVTAEATHGTFIRIRTSDGRAGWVASTDLEKILPTSADAPKKVSI